MSATSNFNRPVLAYDKDDPALGARYGGGGAGSGGGDVEERLNALAKSLETFGGKLDGLVEAGHADRLEASKKTGEVTTRLASIDAKLDAKATSERVAELAGSFRDIPTKFWVGTTFIAITAGAVAALGSILIWLEKIRTALGVH